MSLDRQAELQPGTLVARYRVRRVLGRGATSVVYLAWDTEHGREVALKVLLAELLTDEAYLGRFFNEFHTAVDLRHPHIVRALDAGLTRDQVPYVATEYVDGPTLLERIETRGRLGVSEALRIALETASALDYAWRTLRLAHCDIKPGNILLDRAGRARLADFGLARISGLPAHGNEEEVIVTPLYAAPELVHERAPGDERTDMYALGATLYHMLTGEPPFPGDDTDTVLERHRDETPPRVRDRAPECPEPLERVVQRLLAKQPTARYRSWRQVRLRLRRCRRALQYPWPLLAACWLFLAVSVAGALRENPGLLLDEVASSEALPPGPGGVPETLSPGIDSSAVRRADAYVQLVAGLLLSRPRPEGSLERPVSLLRAYLATHGAHPGSETEQARFLLEHAVPAFEEFLPSLILGFEDLEGVRVRIGRIGRFQVHDLGFERMELLQDDEHGRVITPIPLGELGAETFATLGERLYLAPGTTRAPAPYLAFLLLSGLHADLARALVAFPEVDRSWRVLEQTFQRNAVELEALGLWHKALALFEAGQSVAAYRALQQFRAVNNGRTGVLARHEPEVGRWETWAEPRVPDLAAGRLVRQAQARLATAPAESVSLLLSARTRFGRLSFPERGAIDELLGRATELVLPGLAPTGIAEAATPGEGGLWSLPLLSDRLEPGDRLTDSGTALGLGSLLSRATAAREPEARAWAGIAAVHAGDWINAARLLPRPEELLGLAQPCRALAAAASALRDQRLRDTLPTPLPATTLQDWEQAGLPADARLCLQLRYRCLAGVVDNAPVGLQDLAQRQVPDRWSARAWPLGLTWLLHTRADDQALHLLEQAAALPEAWPLAEAERALLRDLYARLRGDTSDAPLPLAVPAGTACPEEWTLLLTTLEARAALDQLEQEEADALLPLTETALTPATPLLAAAWFDTLLLRIGGHLREHDLQAAGSEIDRALGSTTGAAAAYYARLRLLEAGIQILAGRPGVARETLEFIRYTRGSSPTEGLMPSLAANPLAPEPLPAGFRIDRDPLLWPAWIHWTGHMARRNPAAAEDCLLTGADVHGLGPAHRVFLESLRIATARTE